MTRTDPLAPPPEHDLSPGWGQSLSTGAAGLALLHIAYARAGLAGWDTAHRWAAAMTRSPVAAHRGACLFKGAPAVAFVLRALLTSTPEGVTDYLDADLREPEKILQHAARTLDLTQPVALLLQVLNHITEDDQAHRILTWLLEALPAGSYLLLSHPTAELHRVAMLAYTRLWNDRVTPSITIRSPQQLIRFFAPLELLEPGVVSCSLWRPDPVQIGTPVAVDAFCGVGRKPAATARGEY